MCPKKVMFDNNFGKCGPIFKKKFLHKLIRKKILLSRIF